MSNKKRNKRKQIWQNWKKLDVKRSKEMTKAKDFVNPVIVKEEEYWETEIDCVEACSKAPGEIVIWVRPLAKVKIDALMEKFPAIEWFSYLLGEVKETYIVNDLYIPKQTVTSTSVDNIDAPDFNELPVIGALHSHHGMGNGFSGTDHKYVNGNHNISLVISKDGVAGQVRWNTPCGALKIVDAKVKPLMEVDFDKDEFLKVETEKIEKKTYTPNYNAGGHFINHDPCNHGYGLGTGRVFPALNKEEKELVNELENMEQTESDIDEWINEDQSLVDALKDAFGEEPKTETAIS